MAGYCIIDDEACQEASRQEIVRRYYHTLCDQRLGKADQEAVMKVELLMNKAGVTPEIRGVVKAALERAETTQMPAAAIELPDGTIVTGKTSSLLGASSAVLLNALKALGASTTRSC